MRVLEEVPGFGNEIEGRTHLGGPLTTPRLVEDIVSAAPYEVGRFGPPEQLLIVGSLGGAIPRVVVI